VCVFVLAKFGGQGVKNLAQLYYVGAKFAYQSC